LRIGSGKQTLGNQSTWASLETLRLSGDCEWSLLTKQTPTHNGDSAKSSVTLPGTVEKIIPPAHPSQPEKAQIGVEGAEDLYREIRVDNTLQDENGNQVALKPGAKVDVTIEANPDATQPKPTQ
jgi:hypothetical protein